MFCKCIDTSSCWIILFVYFLLQSFHGTQAQTLAAPDAQFIADFVASSPGFAAAFGNEDICALMPKFLCDDDGHLIEM